MMVPSGNRLLRPSRSFFVKCRAAFCRSLVLFRVRICLRTRVIESKSNWVIVPLQLLTSSNLGGTRIAIICLKETFPTRAFDDLANMEQFGENSDAPEMSNPMDTVNAPLRDSLLQLAIKRCLLKEFNPDTHVASFLACDMNDNLILFSNLSMETSTHRKYRY